MSSSSLPFNVSNDSYRGVVHYLNGDVSNSTAAYRPDPETTTSIVRHLKKLASDHLNTTTIQAIMTVPSWFNDEQRAAVKDCGDRAGLEVLRVIHESTAATLAYEFNRPNIEGEYFFLTVNMGGTSLDVTTTLLEEGVYEIVGAAGNFGLGGERVNDLWADHIVDLIKNKNGIDLRDNSTVIDQLKLEIERAKRALSTQESVTISIPEVYEGENFEQIFSQTEFENMMTPLLKQAVPSIEHAIENARLSKSEVTDVVLAGGAMHMPLLRNLISEYFSKDNVPVRILSHINVTEAVAIGAALQGTVFAEPQFEGCTMTFDVTPLSMGVEIAGGLMDRVVLRGTTLPTKKSRYYTTVVDDQESMTFKIYQGERLMTDNNTYLGKLPSLPLSKGKRGTIKVDLSFTVDPGGDFVNVTASEWPTNESGHPIVSLTLNRTQMGVSDYERIERVVEDAEKYYDEDLVIKEHIEAEVKASIASPEGRKIDGDDWEFVKWVDVELDHEEL
ncbi:heat shock protein 70 family [Dendryphion nanum]|uniref:Heat shock protein 70 family n=1 Tax=Dendryphion nanum TaxID=256645 RepID=A0A9P9IYR3_9PLEO|nr:heat shock protein 70 family [Dendryphion nanum]